MQTVYALCAIVLLGQLVAGLLLAFRAPRQADKVLAVQLISTMGAALVVVLAGLFDSAVLFDVSLVFALLASVTTAAFVRKGWTGAGS